MDIDLLLQILWNSWRGAAAGPSGMTTEQKKILLDGDPGSSLLWDVATLFARGQLPEDILTAVRVGRMTALQKPDGGVRGIVVGDVFRRLVARTIAKQFAEQAEGHPPFPVRPLHEGGGGVRSTHRASTAVWMRMPLCCRLTGSGHTIRSRGGEIFEGWRTGGWREDHPVREAILR